MPCDYKQYPKNWKAIRTRILKRAENKCEHCGVPNRVQVIRGRRLSRAFYVILDGVRGRAYNAITGEILPPSFPWQDDKKAYVVKIVLTIAHLDHDPENHDVRDHRLRALCQKCHLAYDRAERIRKSNETKAITRQKKLDL